MEPHMKSYIVEAPEMVKEGIINLPSSKSISNRVLILRALTGNTLPVSNLSDSDDTRVMEEVFRSSGSHFDIGHAGTAMRFLTAWLSLKDGEWTLTGSERMKQRPIKVLVDALTQLGAKIQLRGCRIKEELSNWTEVFPASIFQHC
jgi:3-phosphoshikimate 1-carboxyvinyltransferase